MDFSFTEEQNFFRQTVRDTVDRLVMPRVQEIDEKGEFPLDLWKEFGRLGYFGLRYPQEYGGMDVDTMQCLMGTYFVARFGTEEIKQRILVPAIKGEKIGTICFTEDQSGSDLSGTRTIAKDEGNHWVINGRKQWITNGPICDFCTVLATVDHALGMKGLNFFLVEEGTPGFIKGKEIDKLGSRGSTTSELLFENVKVPKDHLLGEELGKGVRYAGDILNEVRVMTGLNACAIAREAMEDAKQYANRRVAFGKPIANYQLIREKFGRFWALYEASRTYLYRAAWMSENKTSCLEEAMMGKMLATEMCVEAVDECTRVYGGNAFAMEYPAQRFFRDARFLLYGGGCHEVLLNYLGKKFLEE
jgi:alkylation response protein AidB-like acyl-CoA dehydrogenase